MSNSQNIGEKPEPRLPRPHRCNARVEDLVQALFTLQLTDKVVPAWRNMMNCFSSEAGSEPTDPYLVITDPSDYLDPAKLYKPRPTR